MFPIFSYVPEIDPNLVGSEGNGYFWPECDSDDEDEEALPTVTLRGKNLKNGSAIVEKVDCKSALSTLQEKSVVQVSRKL